MEIKYRPRSIFNNTAEEVCKEDIQNLCMKVRAVKVIRSTMEEIEMLLQRNSGCADRIKVIHLLRDSRGTCNSDLHLPTFRFYIMYKYTNEMTKCINLCCSRILQHITLRKKLETFHPSSFLELHYENVANNLSKAV